MVKTAILDGFRSPFCQEGTLLKDVSPQFLGAMLIKEMTRRMRNWNLDPAKIDYVIGSNVANSIPNLARVASVMGGVDIRIPAYTLNMNCGSGIAAIEQGNLLIQSGRAKIVLIVGIESMSSIPFIYAPGFKSDFIALSRQRSQLKKLRMLIKLYPKLLKVWDSRYAPIYGLIAGLTDPICDLIMGLTAEKLAKDPALKITRGEQDAFAFRSNQRVITAQQNNLFEDEIFSVFVPGRKEYTYAEKDNGVKEPVMDNLRRMKPFFDRRYGSVTPGNSSQVTDGASVILMTSGEIAGALSLPTLGYIENYSAIGFEPSMMGLAPAGAIAKLLRQDEKKLTDFSVVEINEAFAAQTLACLKTMASAKLMTKFFGSYGFENALGEISDDKFNPNGGAIALGHPVGVSGMRLAITALRTLKRTGGENALISTCIGGGQANAMILKRGC
jgi:acetyl-CoA acyltransferase